ncbi:MAG: UPF0149 family protein [Gemmatimonadetes bacterium]|nr:UPF0149 family protein [Gemmatimonadota bacterium]MDA1102937.1 UPF0149 family protein [Gemmatimonadota bacterium]
MKRPRSPSRRDRASLKAFLGRSERPEDMLSYGEMHGFLFTIASAPELVPPSEWFHEVFGSEEPGFADQDEAQRIFTAVTGVYNDIVHQVLSGTADLPADCALRRDVMANFDDDAPVAAWCRGFRHGHFWLEESWNELLPEEMQDELAAIVFSLAFFSEKSIATAVIEDATAPDASVERLAEGLRAEFPQTMKAYARLGRILYEAGLAEEEEGLVPSTVEVVLGRNDPCLCGSGRKFKKCCGRSVH